MSQLPNFPTVVDTWAPSSGANGGNMPASGWVDLTSRTRYATSIKRGKQYELDQMQAGELSTTLNNTDGVLDPLNISGPYAGEIRPYQPFKHAMVNSATTYTQFAGFTERWTPQYQDAGTRAEVQITAVDAFALFSQRTLNDALTEEINLLSPRFLYRLNDPAGSTIAADSTGQFKPAPVTGSRFSAAPYAFGTSITATNATTGTFYSADSVLTLSNPSPGVDSASSGTNVPASYVQLSAVGIKGPANPMLWTRMIAFRASARYGTTSGATNSARLWSSYDSFSTNAPSGASIELRISDTDAELKVGGAANTLGNSVVLAGSGANVTDGNWHLAIFGIDANAGTMLASLDGVTGGAYLAQNFYVGVGNSCVPNGLVSDSIGAMVSQSMGNWSNMAFEGDIAFVAEFPTLLTGAQITNLYTAWRNAGTGDSTDQRYARILRYVGYNGPTYLDSGSTRSMGPADISGSDALTELQAVVDTETGSHWIRGDGAPRFRSRASKFAQLVPTLTFGDGPGEIPYEDLQLDFDPTHLANTVEVTQKSTSQVFTAQDQTSISNYFERLLQRTVNTTSTAECLDCAAYLVSRYKDPLMRVSSIKVNVGAQSGSWALLLPLDLGVRVRVMRRPLGCPPIQLECFIEQIQWDYDFVGNGLLTMQLSPADKVPSAIFAAWRAVTASAVSLGATSITVDAPTFDNQTPLAAQVAVGSQLQIGLGTASPETLTVKAVGATSPGWTSGVITFTSGTSFAHPVNVQVNEPLPSGVIDPTTWDKAATANSVNFAY